MGTADRARLQDTKARLLAAFPPLIKPSKDGDAHAAAHAVRLLRGDAVLLEPVQWAWPGYLPLGMVTILGGAPGCGKTTIAHAMAATMTTGGRWPDGSRCVEAGDVLVWSGEDAHSVAAARLTASGADMTRVHFIDGMTGDGPEFFDPGRDMAALETAALSLPAPRLLILDPIVSAVAGDGNKSNDVRRALQPVVMLAQRLGCAVLGITHFTKGTGGRDPVERITGSLAFGALARVVLVAAKVKADEEGEPRRVLVRAKSNIGPDDGGFSYTLARDEVAPGVEGQRVVWGAAIDGTAREVLGEAEADGEDDSDGPGDAARWLRDLLAGGALAAAEVRRQARDAGFAERTIQRSMRRAGVGSRRRGFGAGAEWFLMPAANRATDPPIAPSAPHAGAGVNGTNGATGGCAADDSEAL